MGYQGWGLTSLPMFLGNCTTGSVRLVGGYSQYEGLLLALHRWVSDH